MLLSSRLLGPDAPKDRATGLPLRREQAITRVSEVEASTGPIVC